uniref:aminotransferase class V-fold PLP-dependent enzyme n=1 Tax=Cyanobium sp. TaxID=2164130 RepID=UPI004047A3A9
MNHQALELHWDFKPGLTYLNHGSFGAVPRQLRQWRTALLDHIEADPVGYLTEELPLALNAARRDLADLVGANPAQLAFVPSTSHGVNELLQRLELPVGSELLLLDHGYNATGNAAAYAAQQRGWTVRQAALPLPLSGADQVVAAVAAAWGPHTRLLLVDHITSPTALVLPVQELVGLARDRGALVVVDGAHGPGQLPLDLAAWQRQGQEPDAYVGNLHKWLCCPRGSAFVWVREPWHEQLRPLVLSHGANAPLGPGQSRFHLEHDWTGTFDPTPWLALPEALRLLAKGQTGRHPQLSGPKPALAQRGQALLLEALAQAGCGPGELIAPPTLQAAMAALPLPPVGALDGPALQRQLLERGFQVPVIPLQPHLPGAPQFLRISCFAYNELADLEGLAGALLELLT